MHISIIASADTTLPSYQHRQWISSRFSISKSVCEEMRILTSTATETVRHFGMKYSLVGDDRPNCIHLLEGHNITLCFDYLYRSAQRIYGIYLQNLLLLLAELTSVSFDLVSPVNYNSHHSTLIY